MKGRTIARSIISPILMLILIFMISGCGGGASGGGAASGGGSGQNIVASTQGSGSTGADISTASSGKAGTFTVTVQLPKPSKARKVNGKVSPYGYNSLKVNIQGEATTKTDTSTITLDGDNKYQKTITGVPVGLNVATIQILDASNNVLAQRTHGFYMQAGGTAEAGTAGTPLPMGVSVTGGTCSPLNIEIPKGTTLYFENLDAGAQTVKVHCDGKTDKTVNLGAATGSSDPDTAATFPYDSMTFGNNDVGTWSYTSPSTTGTVVVYDSPAITALTKRASKEGEEITITGNSFGRSQTSANGTVTFGGAAATTVSSWSNISIKLTVPTGAKSGPLVVTAHGLSSSNNTGFTVMKAIDGGTFTMGQTSVAEPTHTVTISPFQMGKFEVTNAEYCAFLNDNSEGNATEGGSTWWNNVVDDYNGIQDGGESANPRYTVKTNYEKRPVVYVTWYGAVAYCNWASTKDGLTQCYGAKDDRGLPSVWRTKNGYRLATEAEWEYACRAGTDSSQPWYWGAAFGDENSTYCWYISNSSSNHHDVGGKTANLFGLFDMSGNVWEWCSDWDTSYSSGAVTDPTGPDTDKSNRIVRGGCFFDNSGWQQSAVRLSHDPPSQYPGLSFRIARSGTCASMSTLAGGTFSMGQAGVATPVHNVTVSPFYAGRYEITNTEFCAFLNYNTEGNATEGGATWWNAAGSSTYNGITDTVTGNPRYVVISGFEKRPVVYVSWYGAVAYCNWASAKDGLTQCYGAKDDRGLPSVWRTKNGYRLATEAEWEYACRGGTTTAYYWGAAIDGAYCWYNSNSGGNHHDVGGKTANLFGLFDMSGNVWEWCSDWYTGYTGDPAVDPTGPETGGSRVLRGACFNDGSGNCQSAVRGDIVPSFQNADIGFRLVRTK